MLTQTWIRKVSEKIILPAYTPLQVEFRKDGQHRARWVRISGSEFHEPFFAYTVRRVLSNLSDKLTLTTGVDSLLRQKKGKHPSGFIYHVGRCGSTLLANMIKASDQHFILSEPPLPLEALFASPELCSDTQVCDLTRATISAFGGRAPSSTRYFFIKLFNGYILSAPIIRAAIPGVPEVFLYRDPVEVVVSMVKTPAEPWFFFEQLTGLPVSVAVERPMVELAARLVGRLLRAMREHLLDSTLLLNYNQIGSRTPQLLAAHFGFHCDAAKADTMASVLRVDAKALNPNQEYIPDTDRKQKCASAALREAVEEHALEPYLALEQLRLQREFSKRVEEGTTVSTCL